MKDKKIKDLENDLMKKNKEYNEINLKLINEIEKKKELEKTKKKNK